MSQLRILYHIGRADFLERVRRYSFLLTMLFALYLGYNAATGKITLRLGEFRGVYTSAWIGTLIALVTTTFISLAGFYIIKNSIERDRQTGVGQILAATPLSKISYTLGKFLSNVSVLAAMVGVLALAALAMQLFAGEDPRFSLWQLWSPFLFMALPAMALVAALAVLFESIPVLRGGIGNVLYFFLWPFSLGMGEMVKSHLVDPLGLFTVFAGLEPAAQAGIPGYKGGFSLTVDPEPVGVVKSFRWEGVSWSQEVILSRVLWIGVALALVVLAALFFDRFDPARSLRLASRKRFERGVASSARPRSGVPRRSGEVHLTPLDPKATGFGITSMFAAELRLALKGLPWWWFAIAGGLIIAQFASPLSVADGPLLGVAWIWPTLIWSAMGTREARLGTEQILFSAARNRSRQLPACWLAGFVVASLTGCGAAARLLMARDSSAFLAWFAGALFIPTLALFLGIWSGTSKFFEGLYTTLWYIGPMNRVPGLDFTGAASGGRAGEIAAVYLMLTVALFAAALAGRSRQLRAA
jgi:hypothetical protein